MTPRFALFRPGIAFILALLALPLAASAFPAPAAAQHRLRVSDNGHFLVWDDGRPFFYLADTAWELFHRLDREQADHYLRARAALGYTAVQAVALAELDGLNTPNAYGHRPLHDNDPTRPWVVDGPDNDYWDHVDYVVRRANELGLVVALLPTWGDKWNRMQWGAGPEVFTPANAAIYGEWLGRRYRDSGVIWVLGGDRPPSTDGQKAIEEQLALGLRRGDGGAHLITCHPPGAEGSSTWWHDAAWLDFNLRQNGHSPEYFRYAGTLQDYRRTPAKPVIDGEPIYEDHPVDFHSDTLGYSVGADVRRALYWDLFNGACGHTYGHHAVWQMYQPGKYEAVNGPLMSWSDALAAPGAAQMQFGRWLLESRPVLSRIPDPALIVTQTPAMAWPGEGRYRFAGTRDSGGSYAMIYAPVGRRFRVNLRALSGTRIRAWWYDPRDGSARSAGDFNKVDERDFMSPTPGELLDWVLVLDDAAANYPAPGTRR